jgi:hypothetical protein
MSRAVLSGRRYRAWRQPPTIDLFAAHNIVSLAASAGCYDQVKRTSCGVRLGPGAPRPVGAMCMGKHE